MKDCFLAPFPRMRQMISPLRVNSRLWPNPIDSKTDTLIFYTSECICRRIRHEEDG